MVHCEAFGGLWVLCEDVSARARPLNDFKPLITACKCHQAVLTRHQLIQKLVLLDSVRQATPCTCSQSTQLSVSAICASNNM
jgi:hypothetical protein